MGDSSPARRWETTKDGARSSQGFKEAGHLGYAVAARAKSLISNILSWRRLLGHSKPWPMSQKPFPPPYDILTELLVAARQGAGLTQAALADRLQIGQSAVSKVEHGLQRLDLVELHRWLAAIGAPSLASFVTTFEERVGLQAAAERSWSSGRRRKTTVEPVRSSRRGAG